MVEQTDASEAEAWNKQQMSFMPSKPDQTGWEELEPQVSAIPIRFDISHVHLNRVTPSVPPSSNLKWRPTRRVIVLLSSKLCMTLIIFRIAYIISTYKGAAHNSSVHVLMEHGGGVRARSKTSI